jgi:hypothetical protein
MTYICVAVALLRLAVVALAVQPLTGSSRVCVYCNENDTSRYSCKVNFGSTDLQCPFRDDVISIPDCEDTDRFKPETPLCGEVEFDCYATLTEISSNTIYRLQDIKKRNAPCPDQFRIATECNKVPPDCQPPVDPHEPQECANLSGFYTDFEYQTTPEIIEACQALWARGSLFEGEIECTKESYRTDNIFGEWKSPRPPVCNLVERAAATVGVTGLTPGCGLYFWCSPPAPDLGIQWVIEMQQVYGF